MLSESTSPIVDDEHPWLGLYPYTEGTTAYFYGRDQEVKELYLRVREQPLTILFGQTGLGKTSLLGAGLIPKLKVENYRPELIRLGFSPSDPPLIEQVLNSLRRTCGDVFLPHNDFDHARTLWEILHHCPRTPSLTATPPVLIFDQFEEIFTLGKDDPVRQEESEELFVQLADLIENRPPEVVQQRLVKDRLAASEFEMISAPARILITLREDYLSHIEAWKKAMPSLMRNRMALHPLNGTQALEAVVRPGRSMPGRSLVSDQVGTQIVHFITGSTNERPLSEIEAVPPLLSLLCEQLNATRIQRGAAEITSELFENEKEDIKEVFYNNSFAGLPSEVRHYVEDRMLTGSGHRQPVAREDAIAELQTKGVADPASAIDQLIQGRLLSAEERAGLQRIEITHDVLAPLAVKSRDERRVREANERADRQREQAKRNRKVAYAVVTVCLLFLAVALILWIQARAARGVAEGALIVSKYYNEIGVVDSYIASSDERAMLWQLAGLPPEDISTREKLLQTWGEKRESVLRATRRRSQGLRAAMGLNMSLRSQWENEASRHVAEIVKEIEKGDGYLTSDLRFLRELLPELAPVSANNISSAAIPLVVGGVLGDEDIGLDLSYSGPDLRMFAQALSSAEVEKFAIDIVNGMERREPQALSSQAIYEATLVLSRLLPEVPRPAQSQLAARAIRSLLQSAVESNEELEFYRLASSQIPQLSSHLEAATAIEIAKEAAAQISQETRGQVFARLSSFLVAIAAKLDASSAFQAAQGLMPLSLRAQDKSAIAVTARRTILPLLKELTSEQRLLVAKPLVARLKSRDAQKQSHPDEGFLLNSLADVKKLSSQDATEIVSLLLDELKPTLGDAALRYWMVIHLEPFIECLAPDESDRLKPQLVEIVNTAFESKPDRRQFLAICPILTRIAARMSQAGANEFAVSCSQRLLELYPTNGDDEFLAQIDNSLVNVSTSLTFAEGSDVAQQVINLVRDPAFRGDERVTSVASVIKGLGPQLPPQAAAGVVREVVSILEQTPTLRTAQVARLGNAAVTICDSLGGETDEAAQLLAILTDALVRSQQSDPQNGDIQGTAPQTLASLDNSIALLAKRVKSQNLRSAFDALLTAILDPKERYSEKLISLRASAIQVARQLRFSADDPSLDRISESFQGELRSLRLNVPIAVYSTPTDQLQDAKWRPDACRLEGQCRVLAAMLLNVEEHLASPRALEAVIVVIDVLRQSEIARPDVAAVLNNALSMLCKRLSSKSAEHIAKRLVDILRERGLVNRSSVKNSRAEWELAVSFNAVLRKLGRSMNDDARSNVAIYIARVLSSSVDLQDSYASIFLGQIVCYSRRQLPKELAQVARPILDRLYGAEERANGAQMEVYGRRLAVICERMERQKAKVPKTHQLALSALLAVSTTKSTEVPDDVPDSTPISEVETSKKEEALDDDGEPYEEKPPADEEPNRTIASFLEVWGLNAGVAELLEVLKWPFCTGSAQKAVIQALEPKVLSGGQTFDGSIWKVAEWADSEDHLKAIEPAKRPDLDALRKELAAIE